VRVRERGRDVAGERVSAGHPVLVSVSQFLYVFNGYRFSLSVRTCVYFIVLFLYAFSKCCFDRLHKFTHPLPIGYASKTGDTHISKLSKNLTIINVNIGHLARTGGM